MNNNEQNVVGFNILITIGYKLLLYNTLVKDIYNNHYRLLIIIICANTIC
jgi:hypothetical protein